MASPDLGSHPSEQGNTGRFTRFTQREMCVLRLASEGYTNVQIGLKLNISKYTVAQHIAKMLRRVGAANRTDLVNRAHVAGILSDRN